MESNLVLLLLISLGINLVMFIPAFKFKTDKLTDLSYSLAFITLTSVVLILNPLSFLNIIVTLMVFVWAIRLGGFLYLRIRKIDRDKRFDGIRESFSRFFKFWFLQGISVWIILTPVLLFISSDANQVFWPGFFIWLIGLIFEATADYQKSQFKKDPENKNKFIRTGLWRFSRHPNYFGEILCWIGIYLFVFLSLSNPAKLLGLIGPIFIIFLLRFLTGIPPLEKAADKKWKDDEKYQNYKKKTPLLIPRSWKKT